MKKIILTGIVIIILMFIIPIFFTRQFNITSSNVIQDETPEIVINNYDYKQYNTIKLLHKKADTLEEIKLDEYLYNVIAAEMPASFENEALKAQAVVARTYTIYKISKGSKHENANICDDSTCCQAWISKEDRFSKWEEINREIYWNKITNAVNSTAGKIITYNGEAINAFFHANSGGVTEIPINVWGGNGEYPYLQVVQTSGENNYTQYNSQVILTKQELFNKLKEKYNNIEIDYTQEDAIKIIEGTEGGRVKTIKFGNINISGVEARSIFGLRSANFTVVVDGDNVNFEVIGYGHGVGMSQTGADALAKTGSNYEQIIKHFYYGVEIKDL